MAIIYVGNIIIYKELYFTMWHAYQYGQGKLKLVKDLKTGHPHLRASLIDQEQINDLGRVFFSEIRFTKKENPIIKLINNQ